MKKILVASAISSMLMLGCSDSPKQSEPDSAEQPVNAEVGVQDTAKMSLDNIKPMPAEKVNPFYVSWKTPYGLPPFEQIKSEHYGPAFEKAISDQKAEIAAIANNSEPASFANTIEALEYSGKLLTKVSNVFFNLTSADTNDELQAISKDISPKLSALSDDIYLSEPLFKRVKSVFDQRDSLTLRGDQKKLLVDTYTNFVRGGANLNAAQKDQLRLINAELSKLSLEFGNNLLAETNAFELVVENEKDLSGLSESVIAAAAETAKARGKEGKWVFTPNRPSSTPFLTYADNRELRKKMYMGYTMRGNNDNEHDNKNHLAKMSALRAQKAKLMGYESHAHFVLEERTAKTPDRVFNLLDKVWPAALAKAETEVVDMQELANKLGHKIQIEAWDWFYYAEKIRKDRYDLDEEATKPYFSLEATIDGVFITVNKLFGLTFKERTDLPKYHPDVRTWEVYNRDGELQGIFLGDYYVRESKRGGAWMNSYRKQFVDQNGQFNKPIIVNVLNYPRPAGGKPSLLTFDQAGTLFHEFGHALHGLLSDGHYPSQTGTSTPRDFVEFPSQVMENWMTEPEVLASFAKHYKTGEVIPQSMIDKIQAAGQFNQGFATTEYLAASLLDLAWHSHQDTTPKDAAKFEADIVKKYGLISQIAPRYRSTYFSHIFSGGYSAGYYSYIWSEILDADTYSAFKENGIFDQKTAQSFVDNILSKGGTRDPMESFRLFRGRPPKIEPLLEKRGLVIQK
jgi:peptidyl-dipeptidase Dcp